MGQLERYGLYVLCLVIFLILGVAIWGDGERPDSNKIGKVAGSGTVLKDDKEKGDDFEAMLKKQNTSMLDKQRKAEDLFKASDAAANRKDLINPVEVEINPIVDPTPKPVARRTHVVRDGDTLESISKHHLGKRHLWRKILAINPGVDERNLKLGTELKIPPREGIAAGPVAGTRRYLVRKGDSAWGIASKTYGESNAPKYSRLILDLNGITDASALKPGTFIALPK